MRSWSQDVIAWLGQLQAEEGVSRQGQGQGQGAGQGPSRLLACFAAWVRLGCLFETDPVHTAPFIDLAFQLCTSQNEGVASQPACSNNKHMLAIAS